MTLSVSYDDNTHPSQIDNASNYPDNPICKTTRNNVQLLSQSSMSRNPVARKPMTRHEMPTRN